MTPNRSEMTTSFFMRASLPLRLRRRKVQGDAVDAVAQAGRRRAVGEHVAEVSAAAAAVHLGPHHAVGAIHGGLDRSLERLEEARPSRAALELAPGHEERLFAAGAGKG